MKPEEIALEKVIAALRGEMRALQTQNERLREAYESGVKACYMRAAAWEHAANEMLEGEGPPIGGPTKVGVKEGTDEPGEPQVPPEPADQRRGRALGLKRSAIELREATDAFVSESWPSPSWSNV